MPDQDSSVKIMRDKDGLGAVTDMSQKRDNKRQSGILDQKKAINGEIVSGL